MREANLKLGLIGDGAIARELAKYCAANSQRFEIVVALTQSGRENSRRDYPVVGNLGEFLGFQPSLVIECAGHAAVRQYGADVLSAGIDLLLVSAGSLCDDNLFSELRRAEANGGSRLILMAGALPGWDTLSSAALAGLDSVTLRSSKPPAAWRGTPAELKYDLDSLHSPTVVFEGSAREAARLFPKNANIAATAALAGIGFEKTNVILVADPGLVQNTHHLKASGDFGQMSMEIQANPSPGNPKTSLIAALSVLRTLEQEASLRRREQSSMPRVPGSTARNAIVQQRSIVRRIG